MATHLKEVEAHQKTTKARLKHVKTEKNQEVKNMKEELLLQKKVLEARLEDRISKSKRRKLRRRLWRLINLMKNADRKSLILPDWPLPRGWMTPRKESLSITQVSL